MIKAWLSAFRLRTLPLSLSCVATGSFLAGAEGLFKWPVFILAVTTTLFLQILSNLANDYGDSENGADSHERIGPERAVQSGTISIPAMKKAMYIFAALSLVSGLALLFVSFKTQGMLYPILFFILGLGAIAAAVKYTAGKNPYGYRGMGDLFVFIFFGIVGVMGTYFLHTVQFNWMILLPASAVGLLCTGVLNVNNMRDRMSDQNSGKMTLAVKFGFKNSKLYHFGLVLSAIALITIFTIINTSSPYNWLFAIALPLLFIHLWKIAKTSEPKYFDPQLKFLVLSTLFFSLTFGIGLIL